MYQAVRLHSAVGTAVISGYLVGVSVFRSNTVISLWLNLSHSRNILIIHFGLLLKERTLDSIGHDLWKKYNVICLLWMIRYISLLTNIISDLQHIQNTAARILAKCGNSFIHSKIILKKLHWLPIKQRIVYKILITTYKAYHSIAPKYICDLITRREYKRELHSGFLLMHSGVLINPAFAMVWI